MRKKMLVGVSTLLFLAVSVGTVFAYFAYVQRTPIGQFQTGEAAIEVTSQSAPSTNLIPGNTKTFEYILENTGTVAVTAKGMFEGSWSDPGLDPALVAGTILELHDGLGYKTVQSELFDLSDVFYFSQDGTDTNLWELEPGEQWSVRLTVQFSEEADSTYMLSTYSLDAAIAVKEAHSASVWPTF